MPTQSPATGFNLWMDNLGKTCVMEIGRFPKHQAMEQPAGGTSRIILSVAGSSSGGDKPGSILSYRVCSDNDMGLIGAPNTLAKVQVIELLKSMMSSAQK